MRFLFYILILLVGAYGFIYLLDVDTSYIVLNLNGKPVGLKVIPVLVIIGLTFFALYYFIRFLVRLFRIPTDVSQWRLRKKHERAETHLTNGLLSLTQGDWVKAEKAFKKAAPISKAPYLNYLNAARAAQQQGAIERRDDYLKLAYENNPDANVAVGLTQAELQLGHEQTEQALATLKHLHNENPNQVQIKQMLFETYARMDDWQSVLKLLPAIQKSGVFPQEQMLERQRQAYVGILHEAGARKDEPRLDLIWNEIPKKIRQHPYIIEAFVTEKLQFERDDLCEVLLRLRLKQSWDQGLMRLYGLTKATDLTMQLNFAETFLGGYSNNPVLLLTLGRLSLYKTLWAKARMYLEDSLSSSENAEAYYELARIYEQEGNDAKSRECFQKGLALATGRNDYEALPQTTVKADPIDSEPAFNSVEPLDPVDRTEEKPKNRFFKFRG